VFIGTGTKTNTSPYTKKNANEDFYSLSCGDPDPNRRIQNRAKIRTVFEVLRLRLLIEIKWNQAWLDPDPFIST